MLVFLFVFYLLQVGWNTTKDYHTFVWIDVGGEQPTMTRQVIFNGENWFRLSRRGGSGHCLVGPV